ncbi:lymphocyte activation protein 3 protein [Solea senegalensis]|uniref:Lymphocyte activation protein 3 protein n=1 Tax=Solea senegalensis TaxID=28829 RepID=A0AAV6PWI6_SOLSE|nr:lymphocyte activation gene 3 protein-like [Solea senegalensis]KAG7475742.1 lymphocyte activation protein 3 protein [Solea senegalensis]
MSLVCFTVVFVTFLMTGAHCDVTEVFAEAGAPAVLPCKSTNNTPSTIIWTKANKGTVWRKLKSGLQYWGSSWTQKGIQRVQCPHPQFVRGDYSLLINNVQWDDGGLYSCSVEAGGWVAENLVMLRIITVSISPSEPILGRDVSVTCDVTPWPYGASVRWMLNGGPVSSETAVASDGVSSNSIVRKKLAARLSGNWTCVVSYKGKEGRASANLTVRGIIQPPTDNTKVYAAVGSSVTLPCIFSPGLIPSSPAWEKLQPGSLFKPSPSLPLPSFSPSSPSSQNPWDKSTALKEVGLKDVGKYRCSGTIQGQKLTRDMQLVIAKIESSVPSKRKGYVTVTCQLSDDKDVTNYEWVHVSYDVNGTQSFGSIQTGKTLIISLVSEENRGAWVCRFSGKEGILGNITYHVQMMSGLSGQESTGFSHNTAALVGLSLLLLFLLLVVAQMYKNHQRRKRVFPYPALETIVHTIANEREERERNQVKQ